ncbi:helix-turn-helix domain-containing protein [Clostridium septicum]|uniref:Tetratricopeptide repeat protein n=1 Tax=Clostridium septicum TaxID=1504 RepID=A0A9N7JM06_CLOSE|nr:helix-turn-helix domain-containing protein [Clostridium septicum]AYE35018.1 transcriptional regulator [Clostridium septicum]MDU1312606.1 tetratricopeptide repeat protein [Clostridium septicum]QAS60412.1 helix-turn-helix domain-containing protein [Clostridium septicum]UEC22334.1 tetratricopeptide repeat protein [Clostridium septicum]USS02434.1 tetratricopeptide repeat protein [Clostridium septicum]
MEILALGEKIKRRRKELNMTLKDLAGDRITPGQISLVESGRSNPSMDLLEYLADELNTSVEYLMESEESQAEKISIYYEQVAESYILAGEHITAEKYIENALYYSERYDLEYRKAKILYLRARIYMSKGELVLAQQFFLSSNVIFIKNNNYEEIINTFLNLGRITLQLKAYHSASSYLRQAEKVYIDNNIGNDYLLGEIYYFMAQAYFKTDNVGKAMDYSFLAKSKFDQVNNRNEYAKTLLLLSEEYNKKGDLGNAIKYSQKTLEVYRELEELTNVSEIENNLGKLFYEFENIEESFKHYEVAKEIRIKKKDDKLVETLINICENYIKIKNIPKCEEVLKEINGYLKEDDLEGLVEYNLLWYRIYIMKEMPKEAEYILLDSYNLAKANNLNKKAGEIAIMIGKFYIDNKKDFEAAKYLDEGVNVFRKIGILKN